MPGRLGMDKDAWNRKQGRSTILGTEMFLDKIWMSPERVPAERMDQKQKGTGTTSVLQHPRNEYSDTMLIQHSDAIVIQYCDTIVIQCSDAIVIQCSDTTLIQCNDAIVRDTGVLCWQVLGGIAEHDVAEVWVHPAPQHTECSWLWTPQTGSHWLQTTLCEYTLHKNTVSVSVKLVTLSAEHTVGVHPAPEHSVTETGLTGCKPHCEYILHQNTVWLWNWSYWLQTTLCEFTLHQNTVSVSVKLVTLTAEHTLWVQPAPHLCL